MNAELGQLKKQMAALTKGTGTPSSTKNSGRGPPSKKGASTRKKKSTPRAPKKDTDQKAVAPAKGSSRKGPGKNITGGKQKKKPHKQK